jgi:hypothetical protein
MAKIGTIVLPTVTTSINGTQVTYADSNQLQTILNKIATQLDMLTAGQVAAVWNACSAPPTEVGKMITSNPTGAVLGITYSVGDKLLNDTPATFTYNGMTLVRWGWVCTAAGNVGTTNPPTFVAMCTIVA